jgi:eukaryotic-like serine/threonine-protein kinase
LSNLDFIEQIGSGAFGVVWKVRDRGLDAIRAAKLVEPSAIPSLEAYSAEASVLSELEHANIIRVFSTDVGPKTGDTPDVGKYVIVMEYMDGGSLDDALAKEPFIPLRDAVRHVSAACFAATHAHAKDYVHRDIKPANLLVSKQQTKLSDFGLCTPGASGGASGAGTLVYAAPEVVDGDAATLLSDVYSLGVTLYELINGRSFVDWSGDESDLEEAVIRGRFPDRKDFQPFVPDKLRKVVRKAMNVDASKRFASAEDFRHALGAVPLLCGWTLRATGDEERWTGVGSGGVFEVVAKRKHREFEIRRSKSMPGSMRRIKPECGTFSTYAELREHQRRVMSRITEKGK